MFILLDTKDAPRGKLGVIKALSNIKKEALKHLRKNPTLKLEEVRGRDWQVGQYY
jgi:hypothetical protein